MAQKKQQKNSLPKKVTVEPKVVNLDDVGEINKAFRLNLEYGDLDKMLAVLQGEHRCDKLPGEPDRITAPIKEDCKTLADRADQILNGGGWRQTGYDFDFESDLKSTPKNKIAQMKFAEKLGNYKSFPKIPQESQNGKIVVEKQHSWMVTISGDQVIIENPSVKKV